MIFAGAGEVFDRFPEVAAVQLRAALARRTDQYHRESRVERRGYERGLAVARDAFDADVRSVDGGIREHVVEAA